MTDKIRAHMTVRCRKCDICVCPGPIAWQGHTLRLFAAFLCCFDLPIGTATGEMKCSELAVQRRAELWTACAAYAPATPVTSCHAPALCCSVCPFESRTPRIRLLPPLDIEARAAELLSRILLLLENMEGPETRTDQPHITETTTSTGTYLSKDVIFFNWCIEAFLLKVPASLQLRGVKRAAAFPIPLSTPIPRSGQECESLYSALMDTNREATVQHYAIQLTEVLLDELPPSKGSIQYCSIRVTRFAFQGTDRMM